jgi:hypothetical protein
MENTEVSPAHDWLQVPEGASEMKIATIGADLAKGVILIHGVAPHGNTALRKQLWKKTASSGLTMPLVKKMFTSQNTKMPRF